MIRRFVACTVALVAALAVTAHADPKDDVNAAVQKLAAATSYSWTTTTAFGQGQFVQTGKIDTAAGYTSLSLDFGGNTTDMFMKGQKVVVKQDDGTWKTGEELAADQGGGGGGFNPGTMAVRMAQAFKAPADQINTDVATYQNIAKGDDAYTADMTDDQIKQALARRGRRGGGGGGANGGGGAPPAAPDVQNGKGTVKFWITDGNITKIETHVTGTVTFNDQSNDVDRTTTIEFKDIGSTTVDVPDDAKAKLNS